jgi:hypothetical protein
MYEGHMSQDDKLAKILGDEITHRLFGDLEFEDEDCEYLATVSSIEPYDDHFMTDEKGVYVEIFDNEGRKAELHIRIRAYAEEDFGKDEDDE